MIIVLETILFILTTCDRCSKYIYNKLYISTHYCKEIQVNTVDKIYQLLLIVLIIINTFNSTIIMVCDIFRVVCILKKYK